MVKMKCSERDKLSFVTWLGICLEREGLGPELHPRIHMRCSSPWPNTMAEHHGEVPRQREGYTVDVAGPRLFSGRTVDDGTSHREMGPYTGYSRSKIGQHALEAQMRANQKQSKGKKKTIVATL